jgi:YVTN family beta-propeller protein
MDNKSEEQVEILQLSPMIIPGWEDPVLPPGVAHGGISRSIYPDPEGLLMFIDPFTKLLIATGKYENAMAVGDNVTVWLNGEKTSASKTIEAGEESERISLRLESGLLVNGINEMFYRVTRLSGNPNDSEPILKLLYHNPAPGFPAPAGFTIAHPASVGPTEAAQGVVISFKVSYARPYDKVTLTVGTERRTITVTDPAQPITLTLTAADFQQIGDNPQTPISARVVDQLGNSNLSATTFMDIHASQRLLEQAIFRENQGDNNDDPNYVDLEKINSGSLWALVHLIEQVWSANDKIRLKFTAQLGGREVASHEGTLEVTQVPAYFFWDIPIAKVIPDSEVTVIYEQLRGGEVIGISRAATAQVRGQSVPDVEVKFLNDPFTVAPLGRVKDIRLSLTRAGQPVAGIITVTLPAGSEYYDGVKGAREFPTQADGTLTIRGVRGARTSGAYELTAANGGAVATAALTITAYGPLGLIALPDATSGIALSPDGTRVYINGSATVQVISTASSRLIDTIQIPQMAGAWEIALNHNGSLAFACNAFGRISVIDTASSRVINNIPTGGYSIGIVMSKDGSRAFVSTWVGNTVVVIDTETLQIIKTIPVDINPRGIDISPDGFQVYVANYESQTVLIIDTLTLSVITRVSTPMKCYGVAFHPDGDSFYTAGWIATPSSPINGSVVQFSARTLQPIKTIPFKGAPRGIVVNHAGTRAYVCDGAVFTIDTASGTVIASTPVGQLPVEIAISDDDSRAFVVSDLGTVSIISLGSDVSGLGVQNEGSETSPASQPRTLIPGDIF